MIRDAQSFGRESSKSLTRSYSLDVQHVQPPREVFTVATPSHQDGKGLSAQRQLTQDSQTLFGLPSHTSPPALFYAPQRPNLSPGIFSSPSHSGSLSPSLKVLPKDSSLGTPVATIQLQATNVFPLSPSEKCSAPPYASPSAEKANMQQGNFDPKYDSNIMPPVPAYGYPGQQPQPYGQPQPQMSSPPQMQQPMPSTRAVQTMQPAPAPGMDIRNVKGIPRDGNGEREWSHGCSDCFGDCGTCLFGWCCPCMLYSQIQTRYNHLESRGTPHPDGGDSCGGDCFLHCLLTSCLSAGWILQIGQRQSVRQRYRIRGGGCGDCMLAWCCTPCELTQASRELELEERSFIGATAIQQPPMSSYTPNAYPEKP
ncbi:hypothetical protein ACEPAH_2085 [Sanghuangporus vaninii]